MINKNQYFRNKIICFYNRNGRNFYWREKKLTPFQILILELLLKKTKAQTVEKIITGFIRKYPSNKKLYNSKKMNLYNDIKKLGLGNQRVEGLIRISKYIKEQFNHKLPCDEIKLLNIPHIGLYIANATMCFGFNQRFSILDVNTSRVISRFFSIDNTKDIRDNNKLHIKAQKLLPRKYFKEYNWGLLDFGAIVCSTKPLCNECLINKRCNARIKNQK